MKRKLLNGIIPLLLAIIFLSCDRDSESDYYRYDDATIYSTSDKVYLSEIIIFIKPYIQENGQKKFIVTDHIQNLALKINNKKWQVENSYVLDTLHLNNKETIGQYRVTDENIKYPALIDLKNLRESPSTAG